MLVKVFFADEVRRFTLPEESSQLFVALTEALTDSFGVPKQELKITYVDDEGDKCVVAGNEELREAMRFFKTSPVKLVLERVASNASNASNAATSSFLRTESASSNASSSSMKSSEQSPAASIVAPSSSEVASERRSSPPNELRSSASAEFVEDTTLPDRTVHEQGAILPKIWAVKNNGASAWPVGSKLVFVGGSLLPVEAEVALPAANPGETVHIEANVQVPVVASGSELKGDFALVGPDGTRFSNHSSLWVVIVAAERSAPESKEDYAGSPPQAPTCSAPSSAADSAAPEASIPLSIKFLEDVTCPDGSVQECGSTLVKTWAVKNDGSTAWDNVFLVRAKKQHSAIKLTADQGLSMQLPPLQPGESAQVSCTVVLPGKQKEGRHLCNFIVVDAQGTKLRGDHTLFIDVLVQAPLPSVTKAQFLRLASHFLVPDAGQVDAEMHQALSSLLEANPAPVVHSHIACDGCQMFPLVGTRFKCMVCADFDLCMACEADSQHPLDHPLMMCKMPIRPVPTRFLRPQLARPHHLLFRRARQAMQTVTPASIEKSTATAVDRVLPPKVTSALTAAGQRANSAVASAITSAEASLAVTSPISTTVEQSATAAVTAVAPSSLSSTLSSLEKTANSAVAATIATVEKTSNFFVPIMKSVASKLSPSSSSSSSSSPPDSVPTTVSSATPSTAYGNGYGAFSYTAGSRSVLPYAASTTPKQFKAASPYASVATSPSLVYAAPSQAVAASMQPAQHVETAQQPQQQPLKPSSSFGDDEVYPQQLAVLASFGFDDVEKLRELLLIADGDVQRVINWLLIEPRRS